MGRGPATPAPAVTYRPRRTKAKSGCRTCKIRKVKCDESRPACHRCASTGRTCDGYGIWGGGGSSQSQVGVAGTLSFTIAPSPTAASLRIMNAAERDCFQWFMFKTSRKLRGIFTSAFWDTLVFQAGSDEPAVLHASLALGSAQRRQIRERAIPPTGNSVPDEQEQFMLRQYGKAISYLVPQSPGHHQPSAQAVLMTCLVFIFLEFLRGHYKTAQAHLRNGLKLIAEAGCGRKRADKDVDAYKSSGGPIDTGILETFSRIQVQVALLRPFNHHPSAFLLEHEPESITSTFMSVEQARDRLDRLLNEIMQLTEECRQQGIEQSVCEHSEMLFRQQHIRADLTAWRSTYAQSTVTIETAMRFRDAFAYRMLLAYYIMAVIMAETALSPSIECIFDNHTDDFASLLTQSERLRDAIVASAEVDDIQSHHEEAPQSIADMGWIPPLYYAAIKCRVRRLRLQAIELLSSLPHREGIWDTRMAAGIARNVMAIEEAGFYEDGLQETNFSLDKTSNTHMLTPPLLPESYRIQDIQVHLPDRPGGDVGLGYRKRREDGSWEHVEKYFAIASTFSGSLWVSRGSSVARRT
ncbi:hypothetical protein QQX98_004693 [Neonectria punicea]|uniref:Zn(2)-C6 fungal-type domain-containing protein n=1 Tax=Neonectria punicea TaxID=979145 RepID=A0ABR1H8N0_9HYPO